MNWKGTLLAITGLLGTLASPAAAESANLVYTDRGPVRGVVQQDVRSFQGIPFAAPPVGELRWRPPQPVSRWHAPLDASKPRSQCAQLSGLGTVESLDEDCLYVNVTTPAKSRKPLPVMVWFHGGGYTSGAAAMYNPLKLVTRGDVIVVTVGYRLGPLGFLATPELTSETPGRQSGNYGLQDQQAALRWVQRNAAAFGGNPRNVTIFGESAGASSVCMHLVSPTAKGLFHRAIGQSFSCAANVTSKEEGEASGSAFSATLKCPDAQCLRGKPVKDLLTAWPGGFPVIGGREFPLQPPTALSQRKYNDVPILWGSNLDEIRLFVGLQFDGVGNPVTPTQYEQITRATFGPHADKVLAKYPLANYPSPSIALATWQTDGGFGALSTCSHITSYNLFATHSTRTHADAGSAPTNTQAGPAPANPTSTHATSTPANPTFTNTQAGPTATNANSGPISASADSGSTSAYADSAYADSAYADSGSPQTFADVGPASVDVGSGSASAPAQFGAIPANADSDPNSTEAGSGSTPSSPDSGLTPALVGAGSTSALADPGPTSVDADPTQARSRPTPIYAYQFVDRTAPPLIDWPNFDEGAAHAFELSYLWHNLIPTPLTPPQQTLSTQMITYWTTFAHKGNPNNESVPPWPAFKTSDDVQALSLTPPHPINPSIPSNCAFWSTIL